MAKRIFSYPSWTPDAAGVADTTALTTLKYMGVAATGATAGLNVLEIYEGGQASGSSINIMVFARHSTIAVTPTALSAPLSDGPLDTRTATTALGTTFITAGTQPQRSAVTTSAKLNLSFNAFGGIVRWVAAPGEEWGITGITASVSESSLSSFTGSSSGLMGSHIVYEPF
jgi:hypothetical protein